MWGRLASPANRGSARQGILLGLRARARAEGRGMLPRERVLAAIAGERPDRTPRDFWAEKPALERLYAHLGHRDEERLLRDLGIDLRHLNAREPGEVEVSPGLFQNHWGERYIYRPTPWGP